MPSTPTVKNSWGGLPAGYQWDSLHMVASRYQLKIVEALYILVKVEIAKKS
jgi:hypothetical protein